MKKFGVCATPSVYCSRLPRLVEERLAQATVHLSGEDDLVVAEKVREHDTGAAVQALPVVVLRVADARTVDRFRTISDLVVVIAERCRIGQLEVYAIEKLGNAHRAAAGPLALSL